MKISEIEWRSLCQSAGGEKGICIDVGPFVINLKTTEQAFLKTLVLLYRDFSIVTDDYVDFHISMARPSGYRRWVKPQVIFSIDNITPFEPFPVDHAMPLFEWGLNWCIARRSHQYLMLHSAVVEKNGQAIILPASPGSGKSTLCAALMMKGWRLLSDEFGLVRGTDGMFVPMPRPIPLKNQSIQVIQNFSKMAVIGPTFPRTRKGSVAHLRASEQSAQKIKRSVRPSLIVFPRYRIGSDTVLKELSEPYSFLKIASNAFNYEVMGKLGFELITNIINSCACFNVTYSDLDDIIHKLESLLMEHNERSS